MLLELGRNFIKDTLYLHLIAGGVFHDVCPVKGQNIAFDTVYPVKVLAFHILLHRLRHSTHDKILPEIVHCLSVHYLPHGLVGFKPLADNVHQGIIAHRPQKFLKIHRVHLDMPFLGWDDDIFDIFLDGHE